MSPFQKTSCIFLLLTGILFWLTTAFQFSFWWLVVPVFIYLNLLVLGAIYVQWNFYCRSVNHLGNDKTIALTFDDGPAKHTEEILNVLRTEAVPAAFFLIGRKISGNDSSLRRMAAEGHLIGNHSYEHGFRFDWKSFAAMKEEIEKTNQAILSVTGSSCRFFRPPYGVTNPNLAKAIRNSQMQSVGWSLRSFDTKATSETALLNRLLKKVKGGDIILLHDTITFTASILTAFIHEARKRGFTFVRVDQFQ